MSHMRRTAEMESECGFWCFLFSFILGRCSARCQVSTNTVSAIAQNCL